MSNNNDRAHAVDRGNALIEDEFFQRLLGLTQSKVLPMEEFNEMKIPDHLDSEEVWKTLCIIRKSQSIRYHDTCRINGKDIDAWFTETRTIEQILRELTERTRKNSELDLAFKDREGTKFIAEPLLHEAAAAIFCDFQTSYEGILKVVTEKVVPSTDLERLAMNMFELQIHPQIDNDHALTIDFIDSIYTALFEGVDKTALKVIKRTRVVGEEDPMPREAALQEVVGLANGTLVDAAEHPIMVAQRMLTKFWKLAPFEYGNYIMGSLIARYYLIRSGYPVFMYVPLSNISLAWKSGSVPAEIVRSCDDIAPLTEFGKDWTNYWEVYLKLLLIELDLLEQKTFTVKAQDDVLLEYLKNDRTLNYRQIEILCKAVLIPETTFKISEHQKQYDLAYSTARTDLISLYERKYLDMKQEEKAQIFRARFDIKSFLERQYTQRNSYYEPFEAT